MQCHSLTLSQLHHTTLNPLAMALLWVSGIAADTLATLTPVAFLPLVFVYNIFFSVTAKPAYHSS